MTTNPASRPELVADGLSYPTSVAFDEDGNVYVAEAGLPFGGAAAGGRVWKLGNDGGRDLVAKDLRWPVNGLAFHLGRLYIVEGGTPGRISYVDRGGHHVTVLDHLPGPGNYHTNMLAAGPDGKLYFSQGAMTNTGIVGLDAYELGWLRRLPHAHDIPGHPLVLSGINVETVDPLSGDPDARKRTGAFVPFGTPTSRGHRIEAQLPCTAAILRCDAEGGALELVAWGLRNAYGLGFLPDGRLLAVDQGADDRGSRPVANAPDLLFEIRGGAWYGWPDYIGGDPITDARFRPETGLAPAFVLANHDALPPPARPLLTFPPHACAVKFDAIPEGCGAWSGQLLIALFGDERPMTAPPGARVGRAVARIDPGGWTLHPLADTGFLRPIDVRCRREDQSAYVVDFGEFEIDERKGVVARPGTGRVYRLQLAT
jgi:glucose/arabinose dehydrogenase